MKHLDIIPMIFAIFFIILAFGFKNIIAFYALIGWALLVLLFFRNE